MFVQVVKTPLHGDDGKITGLQGIFWDITEQRLADEKNPPCEQSAGAESERASRQEQANAG